MRKITCLMIAFFILSICGAVWNTTAAARPVTELLTAADVAKVSGLTGAKLIPRNPKIGAGGDLNFATAANKMIVMVQVVSKSQYTGYKMFFKAAIKGLGEEAMQGATMPGGAPNLVAFTKGVNCVALSVFLNQNDMKSNMLTMDQTIALAKIIASRL